MEKVWTIQWKLSMDKIQRESAILSENDRKNDVFHMASSRFWIQRESQSLKNLDPQKPTANVIPIVVGVRINRI